MFPNINADISESIWWHVIRKQQLADILCLSCRNRKLSWPGLMIRSYIPWNENYKEELYGPPRTSARYHPMVMSSQNLTSKRRIVNVRKLRTRQWGQRSCELFGATNGICAKGIWLTDKVSEVTVPQKVVRVVTLLLVASIATRNINSFSNIGITVK
jgi:hypothetical protein